MNPLQKIRRSAFSRQKGKCYYCGFSMWQDSAESFAKRHGISVQQASYFQCTAEHLIARQDGGQDVGWNIAAACLRCNRLRHQQKTPMQPKAYQRHVQTRVKQGEWHEVTSLATH